MNNFLDIVLPSQGNYCAVGIKSKKVKPSFHQNTPAIDLVGQGLDAQGVDAYFALASFTDPALGRTADNVAFLRSFFLDIDCGTGKPYNDSAEACKALRIFTTTTGLPIPTVVGSGGGVHVYWPLTEDIDLATWLPLAKALKQLCRNAGLHADPAVTADAARILRIPNTNNYKEEEPRPVFIFKLTEPSELADIVSCLPQPVAPLIDLSAAKQFGMDETSRELGGGDYPKCSFVRIMRKSLKNVGCAQMANALNNAATLEEPLWRAVLSIASRCEDKDVAIHKVSIGHPGYSAYETEKKAAETKGPYTCAWYKDNNPSLCEGCKHNISSPILLGKIVEAATDAPVADPDPVMQYITPVESGDEPVEEVINGIIVEIPPYPYPYFRGAQGGIYRSDRVGGDDVEVEIYSRDLYITGRFFDSDEHGDGEGEMVGINLHMPLDGVRRFHARVSDLFSKEAMREILIDNGVVAYGKQLDLLMGYFANSIRKLQTQFSANKTRSQMGWTPDLLGFVVGELEYTASGVKLAPPSSGTRQLAPAFKPKGDLVEWKTMANFYNREGMEPHALALFFGFGAPLLKLLNNEAVKGALVHLKSNASGSGKTTAQMMVNSIFGHPTELLMTQEDTYNSKMHMLGMMNSIAFTIDEITNALDDELSNTAYGATKGRAKHRMGAKVNELRANNTKWCTITLTSSNASLVDKLAALKSTADGEMRRVFEMEVARIEGIPKAEVDVIFGKIADNYGVAGPVFIKYVVAHLDEVVESLLEMRKKIDAVLDLQNSDRFYSDILACAFVGGLIAKNCELHDIDIPRVYTYALSTVEQNKVANANNIGSPLMVAQETLSGFINENVNNTLVIDNPTNSAVPPAPIISPRQGLKQRYEPDTQELFITAQDFRAYFTKRQVDVRESIKHLVAAGIMKNNGLSVTKRIGAGAIGSLSGLNVRCYCFDGTAIGVSTSSFKATDSEE